MRVEADWDRQRTARFHGDLQALQTASFVGKLLGRHGLDPKMEIDRLARAYDQPHADGPERPGHDEAGELRMPSAQKPAEKMPEGQFVPGERQHPMAMLAEMQIISALGQAQRDAKAKKAGA